MSDRPEPAARAAHEFTAVSRDADRRLDAGAAAEPTNATETSALVGFESGSVAHRVDAALVSRTVGLMTREEFVAGREAAEAAVAAEDAARERARARAEGTKKKRRTGSASALSFDETEEIDPEEAMDEEETVFMKRPIDGMKERRRMGLGKDPTARTEFLPDREREEAEARERAEIEAEYLERASRERGEALEITYSYYDGSRRAGGKISCVKGDTVEAFLGKVRASLLRDGEKTVQRDMKHCDAASMMYVKEDLIIPHDMTFYDLIVTRARGKSGPLFRFDVKDDVRLQTDAREVENSHPGKVILRSWYDRNKNMFPANRWETYEPGKSYATDGYTIK